MQVTEIKSEGLRREFKIAVSAKEIEEKINFRLADLARTVNMPGFRPGKVPVAVMKKRYGGAVLGEVVESAVNDGTRQAMIERGLRPAAEPKVEITSMKEGGDLEYTLAVDVLPEIKPMDFSKLELERLTVAADDAAVEKAINRLAEAHKTSKPVDPARPSAKGDVVVIDFVGSIDGTEFPGGKADGYHLELGSGSFIPGFEDQLVGKSAGDKTEVKVAFPADYGAAELAGKEASFAVTVHEVHESVPSAIDDGLAAKVGMADLAALKGALRDEQGRELKEFSRMKMKRQLLDKLYDAHEFEVPSSLVENEFEAIWRQFEEHRKNTAAGEGDGKDAEALNEKDEEKKTDEEHKAEFQEIAERRVRLGLLLAEVGRLNNIQVSQEDINRAMSAEARRYPGQEKAVMDYYKNSPEAMQALTGPIYEEKVVDFMIELAKVSEREVSIEELMKVDGADADDAEGKKKATKKKAGAKKANKDS